jgi:uncharacterized protein
MAATILAISLTGSSLPSFSQVGSRPAYIYDRADLISSGYELLIDRYLRELDDATTAEIVIYTIPSFVGHGIKKDGQEIQDRDMLANFIFNEVSLDGIIGIGKKGKDNGLLVLLSIGRDAGGGSMRIEVGRGLEGNITDGTAGQILDSYLVPARQEYEDTGDETVFDEAFLNTAVALGARTGYVSDNPDYPNVDDSFDGSPSDIDRLLDYASPGLIFAIIGFVIIVSILSRRGRRRGYYSGYGGGWGGGGGGGGGGGSGGGGAGR